MKIAFLINTSWNIYNFRLSLIKAIQAQGHEVITIAPADEYAQKLVDEGCTFVPITLASRGVNPWQDYQFYRKLLTVFKQQKPDLILSYTIKPNIYGAFAAKKIGIPIISNVTGLGTTFIRTNLIYKVAHYLYRMAFKYPQKVYFQNNDDYSLFINHGLVDEYKAEMVPGSGVNLNKYYPKEKKVTAPYQFLLVSRILKDKGIFEFIEAIRLLKAKRYAAEFTVIGLVEKSADHTGISMKQMQDWVDQGLINYKGFTDHTVKYYQETDCVVLPSYREGMPKSLLEAMAVGKPIVTTNVPGCRDLVKNQENGYLCEPKDAADLARALEKVLLSTPDQLNSMGKRSREIVLDTYDEKFVIFKYLLTIQQLTQKQNGV